MRPKTNASGIQGTAGPYDTMLSASRGTESDLVIVGKVRDPREWATVDWYDLAMVVADGVMAYLSGEASPEDAAFCVGQRRVGCAIYALCTPRFRKAATSDPWARVESGQLGPGHGRAVRGA